MEEVEGFLMADWREELHPRGGKGSPTGGEFVSSGTSKLSAQHEGGGHIKLIQRGIDAIPLEHQKIFVDHGITIKAVETVNSSGGESRLGLFKHSGQITIAAKYNSNGHMMPTKDISGTTVHELGHALDRISSWKFGQQMKSQIDDDAKTMSKNDREWGKYYFTNEKERFAELYRAAFSPGSTAFGMTTKKAQKVFATSIAKLKELKL